MTTKSKVKTILVVDDESALRECFRIFFEMEGLEVFEASNGIEALSLLENQSIDPDLILTDINMPGKDGLQFLKELREQGNQTPVIVMSGRVCSDGIDFSRLDIEHFIAKPILNMETSFREILNGTQ